MEFILPPKITGIPLFCGQPKIHKWDCPLPSYCFWVWWPTDHIYAYITHFIHPLARNLPSHIKDKTFSQPSWKLPPLPSNALLVTADIMPLHTNIPQKEGIATMIHFMEKYKHLLPTKCPPPHVVHVLLDFILKHSTFKFMDTHMHQILGTSMGTRMAPPMSTYSWTRRNAP